MRRVAIIGCPGVGKTFFSIELSKLTGLPITHLDYFYHQKKFSYYEDKKARIVFVKKVIKQDGWIMDGNYSSTFEERFKRADTVVFFDYPRRLTMFRVLKRRIIYQFKRRQEMPSEWKEQADLDFLRYVWNFNKVQRTRILEALDKCKPKKLIVFYKPSDAKSYLEKI